MRLKIASAVEGCLYSLLKTVPGRLSRYSKDLREETDMLIAEAPLQYSCYNVIMDKCATWQAFEV